MNLFCEYIKYLVKRQGRHQIHSPFVFDFVDVCIKTKVKNEDKNLYKKYKSFHFKNKSKYQFEQYGAGSRNKNRPNSISTYSKTASSQGKKWKLLYSISKHYKPNQILELGTNFGFGTLALHLGNPLAKITTVEGSKTLSEINKKSFISFQLENIHLENKTFNSYFEVTKIDNFDLIFIDGDHRGQAVLENINKALAISHDNTLIIIDDIRWSSDMYEAWKQIILDKRFHLTMDLFQVGIIAKMPGKEKEHFVIKY